VISKHSGRNAFRDRLKALGYELDEEEFMRAFRAFKEVADRKKDVTDGDVEAVVADQVLVVAETFRLDRLQVSCGEPSIPTATVLITKADGTVTQDAATGGGPVEAACNAIDRIVTLPIKLVEFTVHSASSGTDAIGEVSVKVESAVEGSFVGRGASTDIIVASAKAYLNAINKVVAAMRERAAGHGRRAVASAIAEMPAVRA
jgi:2-isopropylmalate synthase